MAELMVIFITSLLIWHSQGFEIQSNDPDFLRKQEIVFQLLWSTRERPKNHPEIFERIKNYKIEDIAVACENQTYAKKFEAHLKGSQLPRSKIFSAFREEHVDEVKSLVDVFLSAKSFDEFIAMAAWTGLKLNQISWIHAFAIALAHRSDSKYLCMPNLHEILPHYFFNTDLIIQAYRLKTGELSGIDEQYTIDASNYTGHYPVQDHDDEYKLNYFQEDVGLNEFYFHLTTSCPFWMSGDHCKLPKNIRGEFYYHVHKILLSKYKLERLSRGLGEIEDIDWTQPIVTGFYPSMTHLNGQPFPIREARARVPAFKYKFLEEARQYESRISKAIDLGELRTRATARKRTYGQDDEPTSFNDLCNAIEGNADSPHPKFYGSLDRVYRRILGFAPESKLNGRRWPATPSALEMPFTALRDPGFYRMCKKIVDYGLRFKQNLAAYTKDELSFEGVRIDYVQVERLVSYFEAFVSSVNHPRVLELDEVVPAAKVKIRQFRLAHKPFACQIGVSSERPVKSVIVRLFLGPARDGDDEFELTESLQDFYELDRWIAELKQGSQKLERSSSSAVYYTLGEPRPGEAYRRFLSLGADEEARLRELLQAQKRQRALARRLLLPRGTQAGLALRLLVCIHPIIAEQPAQQLPDDGIFPGMPLDGRPLGFPLDRLLQRELGDFDSLRNIMLKEVFLYHEDIKDVDKD